MEGKHIAFGSLLFFSPFMVYLTGIFLTLAALEITQFGVAIATMCCAETTLILMSIIEVA